MSGTSRAPATATARTTVVRSEGAPTGADTVVSTIMGVADGAPPA